MISKPHLDRPTSDTPSLDEIELDEMDGVSGGCQNCAPGKAAAGGNQLSALAPMLANQVGRAR